MPNCIFYHFSTSFSILLIFFLFLLFSLWICWPLKRILWKFQVPLLKQQSDIATRNWTISKYIQNYLGLETNRISFCFHYWPLISLYFTWAILGNFILHLYFIWFFFILHVDTSRNRHQKSFSFLIFWRRIKSR